jgi:hypothetical protein
MLLAVGIWLSAAQCAAPAGPRYYPTADGPTEIDESVTSGEGPRFTFGSALTSGALAKDVLKILRADPDQYRLIHKEMDDDSLREFLLAHPYKKTNLVNEKEGWVKHLYLVDEWAKQAREKWAEEAKRKYLIDDGFDGYRLLGKIARYDDAPAGSPPPRRRYKVSARMLGPDRVQFYAMLISADAPSPALRNFMMGLLLDHKVKIARHAGQFVLAGRSRRGTYNVLWPTSDRMYVVIDTAGTYPKPVIEAYARRYPSALSADFNYDLNEWMRERIDQNLGILRAMVAPESVGSKNFHTYLTMLWGYVEIDYKCELPYYAPVEEKRKALARFEEWYRVHRDRIGWDPEQRRFVVGDGPAKPFPLVTGKSIGAYLPSWAIPVAALAASAGVGGGVYLHRRRRRAAGS